MISEKFIESVPVYDILTDLSLVAEDVSDDVRISVPDVGVPTGRASHAGDGGARPGPRQADADEGQGAADCRNHLNIT